MATSRPPKPRSDDTTRWISQLRRLDSNQTASGRGESEAYRVRTYRVEPTYGVEPTGWNLEWNL
jgi:hypothetical protein